MPNCLRIWIFERKRGRHEWRKSREKQIWNPYIISIRRKFKYLAINLRHWKYLDKIDYVKRSEGGVLFVIRLSLKFLSNFLKSSLSKNEFCWKMCIFIFLWSSIICNYLIDGMKTSSIWQSDIMNYVSIKKIVRSRFNNKRIGNQNIVTRTSVFRKANNS